jgi:hypothetical protein
MRISQLHNIVDIPYHTPISPLLSADHRERRPVPGRGPRSFHVAPGRARGPWLKAPVEMQASQIVREGLANTSSGG